jgi:hypothetical protein
VRGANYQVFKGAHTRPERYAAFLGRAKDEDRIGESLKPLFQDQEFDQWLAMKKTAGRSVLSAA